MEFSNLLASCMSLQNRGQGSVAEQQNSLQLRSLSDPSRTNNFKNFSCINLPGSIEALMSPSILQSNINQGLPMLEEMKLRKYLKGTSSGALMVSITQPSEQMTMLQGVEQLSRLKSVGSSESNANHASGMNKTKGTSTNNTIEDEKACRRKIKMLLKNRSIVDPTGTVNPCYMEKVEELLFRTAPNINAYSDEKTLNTRLRSLLVALNRRRIRVKAPYKKSSAPLKIPV